MKEYDLLIVGAGVAGLYAWKLAKLNELSSIIIDTNNSFGGQITEYYPEKTIHNLPFIKDNKAINVVTQMYEIAKEYNDDDILFNTSIISIQEIIDDSHLKKTFNIKLTNGDTYNFKKILLCNGLGRLEPIKLIDQNIENIIYFIKDYERFKNKNVVVLGGGDSALDFANELSNVAKHVSIIHRRNEFRTSQAKLDEAESNGVEIIRNYIVVEKPIKNNNLEYLLIKNNEDESTRKIDFDYTIVAYGMVINKDLIPDLNLKLDETKKYLVNENNQTSNENIFACGDCCSYEGKIRNILASQFEVNKAILNIEKDIKNKKISKGW